MKIQTHRLKCSGWVFLAIDAFFSFIKRLLQTMAKLISDC